MLLVKYKTWFRIRHILKLKRIPDTNNLKTGRTMRNYVQLMDEPNMYPRLHFVVAEMTKLRRDIKINFHVDISRHKSEIYHPRIDSIVQLFKNS